MIFVLGKYLKILGFLELFKLIINFRYYLDFEKGMMELLEL